MVYIPNHRLIGFLEDLTNWYVRLNRSRLKGGDGQDSALTSLAVLYEVLLKMAVIMAPFTPFFAEYLYQHLRKRLPRLSWLNAPLDEMGRADSVHYIMLPSVKCAHTDNAVVIGMRLLQQAVELGRRAREAVNISMKTPVKQVVIVCDSAKALSALEGDLEAYVLEELNAWGVLLTSDVDRWCTISALPNLPVLAKRLGKKIRAATNAIKCLDSTNLRSYSKKGSIDINVGGERYWLAEGELIIKSTFSGDKTQYAAMSSSDGALTVAVCITQDDALRRQGIVRELCNRVNKLRKKGKLNIADEIDVFYADIDSSAKCFPEKKTTISTSEALAHDKFLLKKAKICPLPFSYCRGQIIVSDIHATPCGSNMLKITLATPVPTLSLLSRKDFNDNTVLDILLATCNLSQHKLRGSLSDVSFDLITDTEVFPSATHSIASVENRTP